MEAGDFESVSLVPASVMNEPRCPQASPNISRETSLVRGRPFGIPLSPKDILLDLTPSGVFPLCRASRSRLSASRTGGAPSQPPVWPAREPGRRPLAADQRPCFAPRGVDLHPDPSRKSQTG